MITINLDLPFFDEIHPLTLSDDQLIKLLKEVDTGKLIRLLDNLIDEVKSRNDSEIVKVKLNKLKEKL